MEVTTLLRDCVEDYYFPLNLKITSEKTRRHYKFAIDDFEEAIGRAARISDLSDDSVLMLINYLTRQGLSRSTVSDRRSRINALWTFLAKRGIVQKWPTIGELKKVKRTPIAWTKDELASLFAACMKEPGTIGDVPAGPWWIALHCLLWDTAHRISAALASEWQHLRPNGWLILPAETIKGQKADIASRLHEETLQAISRIKSPRRSLILPWPYHPGTLYNRYNKILERAGLPQRRTDKFHRMRKSVASHLEAAGGDATSALGHGSRSVTVEHYIDPSIAKPVQPADHLFRLGDDEKKAG